MTISRSGLIPSLAIALNHRDALLWQPPLPISQVLSLPDFELLHHYTALTTASLSDMAELQHAWKTAVPRVALGHNFLMDIIISLAATHLARKSPTESRDYERKAIMLRNRAMKSAMPSLAHISPSNCDALFAFTGMIALSIFAVPENAHEGSTLSPVDEIVSFFPLVRGVGNLLRSGDTLAWVSEGCLQVLIEPRGRWPVAWQKDNCLLPADLNPKMDQLDVLNEETSCKEEERQFYASAIRALRTAFGKFITNPDGRSALFVWGGIIPDELLTAMHAHEPLALVLLAHYAVLIHYAKDCWWCGDRGARLIRAIQLELPSEWWPAIQWPWEMTQGAG